MASYRPGCDCAVPMMSKYCVELLFLWDSPAGARPPSLSCVFTSRYRPCWVLGVVPSVNRRRFQCQKTAFADGVFSVNRRRFHAVLVGGFALCSLHLKYFLYKARSLPVSITSSNAVWSPFLRPYSGIVGVTHNKRRLYYLLTA